MNNINKGVTMSGNINTVTSNFITNNYVNDTSHIKKKKSGIINHNEHDTKNSHRQTRNSINIFKDKMSKSKRSTPGKDRINCVNNSYNILPFIQLDSTIHFLNLYFI